MSSAVIHGPFGDITESSTVEEVNAALGVSTLRPVPRSITKRQLYRGLREKGWLGSTKDQIEASIDALLSQMPEPPRELARIEFYTSRDYLRDNVLLVNALKAPPLSLSDEAIDDFWRLCSSFAPEGEA